MLEDRDYMGMMVGGCELIVGDMRVIEGEAR